MEPISLLWKRSGCLPWHRSSSAWKSGRTADQRPEMPVFVAPHDELERLTGFEPTRGALGAFRRPAPPTVADVLHEARLVAVLEDITNHTNTGAIFRSAAALGVDAVLVSPACYATCCTAAPCACPWAPFSWAPCTRIGDADVPNRPGCGTPER